MAIPKKMENGKWKIQVQIDGKRVAKRFDTHAKAIEWAAGTRTDAEAVATKGEGSIKTLRDAIERFRDEVTPKRAGQKWEHTRCEAFLKGAENGHPLPLDVRLDDLTPDHMQHWSDVRATLTAPGTVLRDSNLLSSIFTQAKVWKWLKVSPLIGVKKPSAPRHRERLISGPEIRKMLRRLNYNGTAIDSIQRKVAAAFLLALLTGMRASEITTLEWAEVFSNYINLRETKTDPRKVMLSASARKFLARLNAIKDGPLVLQGLTSDQLDINYRKYRKQLGALPGFKGDFTFHDARHTAATALAVDLPLLALCKSFGWRDPKHAMIYYNPKVDAMAREYEARRLERHQRNARVVEVTSVMQLVK